MGTPLYDAGMRSMRAKVSGFHTKSVNDIFEQNKVKKIHESMDPSKAHLREARDSENHPKSVPIILALDVTGSMREIPHHLIKDGLPHIMDGIIQRGEKDPQILFLAIGDTTYDKHPLQVGQFESGDVELDTWLTRTYLEGGGGGNEGESYLLAWYFAAMHCVTDHWEKRKQKGFLFTTGDEPCLKNLPKNVIQHLMGPGVEARAWTDEELLAEARKKWTVIHLHVMQGSAGPRSLPYWKELLGENCIQVDNYDDISKVITEIVTNGKATTVVVDEEEEGSGAATPTVTIPVDVDDEEML